MIAFDMEAEARLSADMGPTRTRRILVGIALGIRSWRRLHSENINCAAWALQRRARVDNLFISSETQINRHKSF